VILFRVYVEASDQSKAEAIASGYLLLLKRAAPFKVKLVQPYWKINGQYEVLLESAGNSREGVISNIVSLLGVSSQQISETEAIWSDVGDGFPLAGARWAHVELI
jgi:hypothetical protein